MNRIMKRLLPAFLILSGGVAPAAGEETGAVFRISEVEVHPGFSGPYAEAGKAVASASVGREPGVICIVPLRSKENPTLFRIVEIYADHMIKSLSLPDFIPVNPEGLPAVFRKMPSDPG